MKVIEIIVIEDSIMECWSLLVCFTKLQMK